RRMRSDSRRAQSYWRTLPLYTHDDAAQSDCLSKARGEDGRAARGTFTSGCDGGNAKTRNRSAGLSCVKCSGVCIKRLFFAPALDTSTATINATLLIARDYLR